MRLLRHLNISTMLGLFSAIALALLGLLTWSTAVGTTDLMALRDHAQRVQMAQFATMEARGFARPLPGLAGRIVLAQNAASITQSLADADAASERAVGRLRALLDQQPNPAAVPALAKMIQSVGAYQGVIHQLATARLALLTRRNDEMEALRARFDTAVETATGAMHFEDMGATDADRWRARLIRYQRAVQRNAGVVERHLLIHDPDLLRQVQLSSEVATALIKAARTETVPDEAKDALDRMDALGQAVLACGAALLQDDAAVQAIAAGPLPTAEQTLDNDIQFVMDLSAAFVGGSVGEARSALAALTRHLAWIACSIAATLAVSGYATARVIGRPLKRMTQDVRRMAAGDTDQPVHGAESRNELGRMAAALEQLRGVVREACIQAQVVEQIPIGLLTADARDDLRITFVNQAGRAHLQALHAALGLPDADPVGDSIRHFEPFLPGLVAHHLSPDALPYSSRVQVGDDTLDLCASALFDRSGAYAGPLVTWTSVARQVALASEFQRSVGRIVEVVGASAGAMERVAEAMDSTAEQNGTRAAAVAAASLQASGNVAAVARSAGELAHSVTEITRQVTESARIAGRAVDEAVATDRCIAGLSDAAGRIGDVVRLIGDIAARTNLLALNATIEAARAGTAGRGFAVVAGEVKTLANQTARATDEIAAQIAAMQGETDQAVTALRSIGGTIQRLDEIATAIANAVEEQGVATREIATAVQQAADGTTEVNGNISAVTSAAGQTRAQAGEVLSAAGALSTQSDALQAEVSRFLQSLRAA